MSAAAQADGAGGLPPRAQRDQSRLWRRVKSESFRKRRPAGREFKSPTQVDAFFRVLADKLEWMSDCDVILYQAGADPHIRDPLGGWMTTEQLFKRDRMVFDACKLMNVGVAWNLAGGYQTNPNGSTNWPAILEIHDNTMKACWEVFGDG